MVTTHTWNNHMGRWQGSRSFCFSSCHHLALKKPRPNRECSYGFFLGWTRCIHPCLFIGISGLFLYRFSASSHHQHWRHKWPEEPGVGGASTLCDWYIPCEFLSTSHELGVEDKQWTVSRLLSWGSHSTCVCGGDISKAQVNKDITEFQMAVSAVNEIEQGIVIVTRGALLAGLAREALFEERTESWEEPKTEQYKLREESGGKCAVSKEQREGMCVCKVVGEEKMDSRQRWRRGQHKEIDGFSSGLVNDLIWFIFLKEHPGCYLESGLDRLRIKVGSVTPP